MWEYIFSQNNRTTKGTNDVSVRTKNEQNRYKYQSKIKTEVDIFCVKTIYQINQRNGWCKKEDN